MSEKCPACAAGKHDECFHKYEVEDWDLLECLCTECSKEQELAAEKRYHDRRRKERRAF